MKRILAGIGLLVLSAGSASSEHQTCGRATCPHEVELASVADGKVYGLLLGAPDAGCRRVRYRVETTGQVLLGKTPALAAGEVAVVLIGNGFPTGPHILTVTGEGCSKAPGLSRRVTLRKTSPDHGWRASVANAALAVTP
jgi:hypothetical protein